MMKKAEISFSYVIGIILLVIGILLLTILISGLAGNAQEIGEHIKKLVGDVL